MSMSPIPFRMELATEDDWPWILQGHVRTAWESLPASRRRGVTLQGLQEGIRQQIDHLRRPDGPPYLALVAWDDRGNRAGALLVETSSSGMTGECFAYVTLIFVVQASRRQGLGQLLLARAEEWARRQRLPRLALNVAAHNIPAQALYAAAGYQVENLKMGKELG